jgi:simple sugar transport system substrate-binding protein
MTNRAIVAVLVVVVAIIAGLAGYSLKPSGVAENKPGKGLTFCLIANGTAGQSFWEIIRHGAEDAAKSLGVNLVMRYYEETPEKAVSVMDEAIAAHYDGIIISDIFQDLLRPKINQAVDAGIPVMTILVDDPQSERIAFVGYKAGYYDHGRIVAEAIAPKVHDGDKVLMVAEAIAFWSEERMRGFRETLENLKRGLTFDVLECGNELSVAEPRIRSYLVAHPDVKVMYGAGEVTNVLFPIIAKDLGYKPGQIVMGMNGVAPGVPEAIKEGWVEASFLGDQYLTAYMAVQEMFLHVKYGFGGFDIRTGYTLVTKSNIDKIEPWAKQGYY